MLTRAFLRTCVQRIQGGFPSPLKTMLCTTKTTNRNSHIMRDLTAHTDICNQFHILQDKYISKDSYCSPILRQGFHDFYIFCSNILSPAVTPQLSGFDMAGQNGRPPRVETNIKIGIENYSKKILPRSFVTCRLHLLPVILACTSSHPRFCVHFQTLWHRHATTTKCT